jgi:hypothetical protein
MHSPPCNGKAIMAAIRTSFKKSFESILTIPVTEAPSTLRIPISFVFCSAVKVTRPNKPRQEINMARKANI